MVTPLNHDQVQWAPLECTPPKWWSELISCPVTEAHNDISITFLDKGFRLNLRKELFL